jgi:CII-binding regulator of phage lambda lysogenization HflD
MNIIYIFISLILSLTITYYIDYYGNIILNIIKDRENKIKKLRIVEEELSQEIQKYNYNIKYLENEIIKKEEKIKEINEINKELKLSNEELVLFNEELVSLLHYRDYDIQMLENEIDNLKSVIIKNQKND